MKPKMVITAILVVFVIVSAAFLIIQETRDAVEPVSVVKAAITAPDQMTSDAVSEKKMTSESDVDIVYYFHTTARCPSCLKIEAYTKEAVEENFQKKIDDKSLLWKMVKVDEQSNRHFIQDFQLITKSVVLVKYRDGKKMEWKNLDQVWHLLGDKTAFQNYITNEVKAFIREQG